MYCFCIFNLQKLNLKKNNSGAMHIIHIIFYLTSLTFHWIEKISSCNIIFMLLFYMVYNFLRCSIGISLNLLIYLHEINIFRKGIIFIQADTIFFLCLNLFKISMASYSLFCICHRHCLFNSLLEFFLAG